jgi:hypothetical protein
MYSKTAIALTLFACTLPAHADGTAQQEWVRLGILHNL